MNSTFENALSHSLVVAKVSKTHSLKRGVYAVGDAGW